MNKYVLAIGFTVATVGVAQADCERSITNETAIGYEYVIYHAQGDAYVEERRGSLPSGDVASIKLASANAPMQLRFLAAGETDAENFIVLFNIREDAIANCAFDSASSEGFCLDSPEPGYITIMDPLRNCGRS